MKFKGERMIAQDAAFSLVFGILKSAINIDATMEILSLEEIGSYLGARLLK